MQIFLALVAPDHEAATVIGVFSTLELAQAAFPEGRWVFNPRYGQCWRKPFDRESYTDDEIHVLTLDQALGASLP